MTQILLSIIEGNIVVSGEGKMSSSTKRPRIAVCGSDGVISPKVEAVANQVGREIAENGGILICGGRGGVMEAASRGAKEAKGITVGILPGADSREANSYVDVPIPTSLERLRNFLVVRAAEAVICISGRWGTLSEIAMAMDIGLPVIIIRGTGGVVDWLTENPLRIDQKECVSTDGADKAVKIALSSIQ